MDDIISIHGAAFSYEDNEVFSGLNLSVYKGELLCLLGSNGCGKTTLLRCMNAALKLKQGKVMLDNRDITTMTTTEVAKKIGFVFQEHSAPFPYSIIDVVCMGRAPHLSLFSAPSSADRRIAIEALQMVDMLHLKDKPYTKISGGQRQLILIARTIAQQPEVILLDEPTSHLDFRNQTLILRMINRLVQQGLSIVMSSHIPDHALLHSGRVALMKDGGFLAVGSPDKVITEDNLRTIYGINVSILSANDPASGDKIRFCIPAKERPNITNSNPER